METTRRTTVGIGRYSSEGRSETRADDWNGRSHVDNLLDGFIFIHILFDRPARHDTTARARLVIPPPRNTSPASPCRSTHFILVLVIILIPIILSSTLWNANATSSVPTFLLLQLPSTRIVPRDIPIARLQIHDLALLQRSIRDSSIQADAPITPVRLCAPTEPHSRITLDFQHRYSYVSLSARIATLARAYRD